MSAQHDEPAIGSLVLAPGCRVIQHSLLASQVGSITHKVRNYYEQGRTRGCPMVRRARRFLSPISRWSYRSKGREFGVYWIGASVGAAGWEVLEPRICRAISR